MADFGDEFKREERLVQRHIRERMQQFQDDNNYTDRQMAFRLKTITARYQQYVDGDRVVPLVIIAKFCEVAGIDLHELVKQALRGD